jgi:peptidase S46-like protein
MNAALVRRTALLAVIALPALAAADEGMWTFDNLPLKLLHDKYGFAPSKEWLDRVRLASVRFNDGGSGSFVSPDGLMITNHHVGLGCIQNISTEANDYVAAGFMAASRDREPACPGYEVNVLVAMEDVTARVLGAVKPAMTDRQAGEARKGATARVEKECADRTGQRCEVIPLYQGGEYQLYTYKKYTDVRLVFAPEQQTAFFGGDDDNFTFPRHDLDICIMRAYENGAPARPAAYLPWARAGAEDGDLVFVSGNPGSTSRLETLAQLESERRVIQPTVLRSLERRIANLRAYAAKSPENERRAKEYIFGYANSIKAREGMLKALQDRKAMAAQQSAESDLRRRYGAGRAGAAGTDPWATIAAAQRRFDARFPEYRQLEGLMHAPRLPGIAGDIVRYVAEKQKPNDVRLEEFRDSNLESLENELYSPAPIYDDLEEVMLADRLKEASEALGPGNPIARTVLGGRTPEEVAHQAVAGTRLKDVAARKALVEGGPAAVAASNDPMIALARKIDPLARQVRSFKEDDVEAVQKRAGERIAQARWKAFGRTLSPDATFTLRLAFGVVKPYPAEGTMAPARTTFHGLYDRSASFRNRPPWNLMPRWVEHEKDLELKTPFNFVCTADIIGGNSGSPVINKDGEFVGIIFDGNIESLASDYYYSDEVARAVAVDARGIVEALRKVYGAAPLVQELSSK